MSERTEALAKALEEGARALVAFVNDLSDEQWQTPLPHDGRKVGVVVHHVATVYPLEINFARSVAAGTPDGITMDAANQMNARHATKFDGITKQDALELLTTNSAAAAAAIRSLTDEELDRSAPVPLYGNARVTCQFILEDHAVRHSLHHLARMKAAMNSSNP
jgi:uncharacterized damage-inducible protein DinB